jgi:hypothetical protein
MTDLDTIARRAGAATRAEADARVPHLTFPPDAARRGGTRRTVLALAAAAVAIAVAVTLVVGPFADDRSIVIDPVAPETTEDTPTDPDAVGVGEFVAVGSLEMHCMWCSATLLDDGRVLVVGKRAELYDPTTATFTPTGPPATDYGQGASVRLADGRVLVVSALESAVELYDPTTGVFAAVPGSIETVLEALSRPPAAEPSATPVVLTDGRVLLVGRAAAGIFDPDTGELGPTAPMAEVRPSGSTATLLDDGRVLVAGGAPVAEVYDPATGTFTPTGPLTSALGYHTATVLGDGRVLLAGGESEAGQLFDPVTGSFTPTGSMARARSMHTATLLPDGRVLVVGGADGSAAADRGVARTAEIYDPTTGQFTPAPDPTGDRRAATAITLNNGDVLVLGNYPGNGGLWPATDSPTAEIFSLTGFEPPPGCCPQVPSDLVFQATIEPSEWAALAGQSIHATVTIPPGGIDGATAATFQWSADDASDGVGEGGEYPLPSDCHDGCQLTIPIPLPPETAAAAELTVTAHLAINYSASPPAPAERITIQIDAD